MVLTRYLLWQTEIVLVLAGNSPEGMNRLIDELTEVYYVFRNLERMGCMPATLGHHMAVLTDLVLEFGRQFTRIEATHPDYRIFKETIMSDYSRLLEILAENNPLTSNEIDRKNIVKQLNGQLSVLLVKLNSMKSPK